MYRPTMSTQAATMRRVFVTACFLLSSAVVVSQQYDIVVYGSTPGGIMAAIAAANTTATVALVSATAHVGGMTAGGLGQTDIGNPAAVGGLAHHFFELVCAKYGKTGACYQYEPHVAEAVFMDMIAAQPTLTLVLSQTLVSLTKDNLAVAIVSIGTNPTADVVRSVPAALTTTTTFSAKVFIDASYEGDLLALAGVPFATGREGVSQYNESLGGRLLVPNNHGGHQFNFPVNYTDSHGNLLPMIYTGDPGVVGQADEKVQAYNFRMCFSSNVTNQVPIPKPDNYDAAYWELFRRYLAAGNFTDLGELMNISIMPNHKTDVNNNGAISTDFIGGSWKWPTAAPAARIAIYQAHVDYTAGFFYFLANDAAVPGSIRKQMQSWGLAKDEFVDNGNWPYQLYVREGRRMIGQYVFTQWDRQFNLTKPDSVGLFSYNIDTHNAQRFPQGDFVRNEGDVEMFGNLGMGQIPYRSLIPRAQDATNLLAPVPMSASHLGYGTIRLEPQFMILGQSSGIAAAQAVAAGQAVQEIDVGTLQASLLAAGQILDVPA